MGRGVVSERYTTTRRRPLTAAPPNKSKSPLIRSQIQARRGSQPHRPLVIERNSQLHRLVNATALQHAIIFPRFAMILYSSTCFRSRCLAPNRRNSTKGGGNFYVGTLRSDRIIRIQSREFLIRSDFTADYFQSVREVLNTRENLINITLFKVKINNYLMFNDFDVDFVFWPSWTILFCRLSLKLAETTFSAFQNFNRSYSLQSVRW